MADLAYYDNMPVSIPALVTPAEYATQIRIFATEKGLYVSSDMEQPPDSWLRDTRVATTLSIATPWGNNRRSPAKP